MADCQDEDDKGDVTPVTTGSAGTSKWRGSCRCRIWSALTIVVLIAVGLLVGLLVPKSRQTAAANESAANVNNGGSTTNVTDIKDDGDVDGVASNSSEEEDSSDENVGGKIVQPRQPWPHDESDIPADPAVVFGTLDNGLKYAVMSNPEPPDRLSLRLHVGAGSLHEEEDQRGLAHFLEHMMFNGLCSFPDAADLAEEMERLGVGFGQHVNAYTTYDETVYKLDLPGTDNHTTGFGFTVLRDWADCALLDVDEIDSERGVVISEMELRDSVQDRIFLQQLEFLVPDHRIEHRDVIGTKEVLSTAPRERFLDFYKKYYVSSRMTIIAVGDMNTTDLETLIHDTFENMTEENGGAADPDMGSVPMGFGLRARAFVDEELSYDILSITSLRSYQPGPDTKAERIRRIRLSLAHTIIDRRFKALSREEGSLILGGGIYQYITAQALDQGEIYIIPSDGRWQDTVQLLEQEFRRVLEHGFTGIEVNEAKADILEAYDEAVKKAPSRHSDTLADQLRAAVSRRRVFTSPVENLRIAEEAISEVTPQLVHSAFKEYWNTEDLSLLLVSREAPTDAADILMALYMESTAVEVTPPEEYEAGPFNYTDFGTPGSIVSDDAVDDLDIRQLVLSNNIRLNMKQTDFQANSIKIVARFGIGRLGQPQDKTWLDQFARDVMNNGGLGRHTNIDLQRILAGKTVSLGFSVNDGAFSLTSSTAPDDLELQLQLMAAFLSDPGYRKTQFHSRIPYYMAELKHTFNGAYKHAHAWLWGGDGRFAVPTEDDLMGLEVSDVFDWIHDQLLGTYLEVSIVGDFDPEVALPLILETIGALPERADAPPGIDNETRAIAFPAAPDTRVFTYETKAPQAAAMVGWRVPALLTEDVETYRRIGLLARILDDRMAQRIREDLGDSYAARARMVVSDAFDHGMIRAISPGDPADSVRIIALIVDIANNITFDVTEDELIRAKKPFQTTLEDSLRDNSHWLRVVMEECQSKPHVLDWSRNRDKDYESISLAEIKALSAKYLAPQNALRIEVLPVSGNETGSERKLSNYTALLPDLISFSDPFDNSFDPLLLI